ENDLPVLIEEKFRYLSFDYTKLREILSSNFNGFEDYTELLHSGMNTSLKMEYRWLEFYKLIEMHFGVPSRKLNGSHTEWITFLENFRQELSLFLRPNQPLHSLMTDLRNGAAHFVTTNKCEKITEARQETLYKVHNTFPVITNMIVKIINEHPDNKQLRLKTNFIK
ncbi:MAG TPA: hypothetical protein VFJ43_15815, partial [Bacteroidia bacterium]|nr:hypothetical protein [Bacteroidia bacterium]